MNESFYDAAKIDILIKIYFMQLLIIDACR